MSEAALRRRDPNSIERRLRHEGVDQRRRALRGAENGVVQAAAALTEWDRRIAELVDRSRGELPPREAMDDLRAHRERARFGRAQKDAALLAAQAALTTALETAPTSEQIAAWQDELEAGLEERRRAAELLADPAFERRIREISAALGSPSGLTSLRAEIGHIANHAHAIRESFVTRNTISKTWWMPGVEEDSTDV